MLSTLIPHVPLVEANIYVVITALLRLHSIDNGAHFLNKAIHIDAGCHEALQIAIVMSWLIVGVARQEVHQIVGVFEHGFFPLTEGWHIVSCRTAHRQLQVWIDLTQTARNISRQHTVIFCRLMTEPPWAVHFVAQAPEANIEWLFGTVCFALIR